MYRVEIPQTEKEFDEYFAFRWQMLRKPWNYPQGSEKDEYEQVGSHRMVRGRKGEVVAIGRLHFNTPEEAQLRHIAVHPEYQRKGLGRLILSSLESVARSEGIERIVTNSRELSVPFFKSCGFDEEGEVAADLGQLKREQMVKKLTECNAVLLHPDWCRELQTTWHETIPISEQMGIKLFQYTGRTLETRASLNKNINLHKTMFAGSIFSLATLTGWGMLFLMLKQKKLTGDIVMGDANIHYHKPITTQPRALCHTESIKGTLQKLENGKKAPFDLTVEILDETKAVAEFKATYWILPVESSDA